jgi:hypothetical protein
VRRYKLGGSFNIIHEKKILSSTIITMKNDTQKMIMFIALGAAIATLVFYFSGQLKFVEMLEGESDSDSDDEGEEGMDGEPLPMGESDSESESDDEA